MKTLVAFLGLVALMQQAPVPPAGQHVQKIVLNVSNNAGSYAIGLKKEDFILEEGGVEKEITGLSESSDVPISFGLLIDKSTSMRLPMYVEGREYVPAALLAGTRIGRALVRLMRPEDEFLLMTFDYKLHVKQNFTQDHKKIENELAKLHEVGENTHLYESIPDALDKMKKAKYRQRALIVITDAYDTSGKEFEDLRFKIAEYEIPVFTCGLRAAFDNIQDPGAESLFQLVLRGLSTDTGGLSAVIDIPELNNERMIEGLIRFAQIITLEMRGQYTLTYNTEQSGPLASRFIRVRSTRPELRVRLRRDADQPLAAPAK